MELTRKIKPKPVYGKGGSPKLVSVWHRSEKLYPSDKHLKPK